MLFMYSARVGSCSKARVAETEPPGGGGVVSRETQPNEAGRGGTRGQHPNGACRGSGRNGSPRPHTPPPEWGVPPRAAPSNIARGRNTTHLPGCLLKQSDCLLVVASVGKLQGSCVQHAGAANVRGRGHERLGRRHVRDSQQRRQHQKCTRSPRTGPHCSDCCGVSRCGAVLGSPRPARLAQKPRM
jgi:hypothetical protein